MILLRPFYAFFYIINLFYNIAKSSVETLFHSTTGKIDPQVIEVKTGLKKDISHFVLANSITLTPGTLTVAIDHDMQTLKVAVLTPRKPESVIPFERYIRGMFE